MNTRAKGRKNELAYKKILESRGYQVRLTPSPQKFAKEQDFFGQFDGFAVNDKEYIWFQVKSNTTAGAPKKIKKWIGENKLPNNSRYIVAVRIDGKGGQKVVWREIEI